MGQLISSLMDSSYQVVMLGLDDAGKSTVLKSLQQSPDGIHPGPTIGFNISKLMASLPMGKKQQCVFWDVSGQENCRWLWKMYVKRTDAIIYVVDVANQVRLDESRDELFNLLQPQIVPLETPIILLMNKTDLPQEKTNTEINSILGLERLRHTICCRRSSAITGEGLGNFVDDVAAIVFNAKKGRHR